MEYVIGLIIGLIIGWIAKWAYDAFTASKSETMTYQVPSVEGKLTEAEMQILKLQNQLKELRNRSPKVVVKEKDRLEKIHGIGPVFARRLQEAGVYSFGDLAQLDPERVKTIISPQDWQAIDPQGWIHQANQYAQQVEENHQPNV